MICRLLSVLTQNISIAQRSSDPVCHLSLGTTPTGPNSSGTHRKASQQLLAFLKKGGQVSHQLFRDGKTNFPQVFNLIDFNYFWIWSFSSCMHLLLLPSVTSYSSFLHVSPALFHSKLICKPLMLLLSVGEIPSPCPISLYGFFYIFWLVYITPISLLFSWLSWVFQISHYT